MTVVWSSAVACCGAVLFCAPSVPRQSAAVSPSRIQPDIVFFTVPPRLSPRARKSRRRPRHIIFGIEHHAPLPSFTLALGPQVGLVAQGEMQNAALARGHWPEL